MDIYGNTVKSDSYDDGMEVINPLTEDSDEMKLKSINRR